MFLRVTLKYSENTRHAYGRLGMQPNPHRNSFLLVSRCDRSPSFIIRNVLIREPTLRYSEDSTLASSPQPQYSPASLSSIGDYFMPCDIRRVLRAPICYIIGIYVYIANIQMLVPHSGHSHHCNDSEYRRGCTRLLSH